MAGKNGKEQLIDLKIENAIGKLRTDIIKEIREYIEQSNRHEQILAGETGLVAECNATQKRIGRLEGWRSYVTGIFVVVVFLLSLVSGCAWIRMDNTLETIQKMQTQQVK